MTSAVGLESAAGGCSVALVRGAEVIAARSDVFARGHATRLPVLVAELLARAGPLPPIGLVAVGIGPGSFTGLRAGIALAHGLAAGWGCPVAGVPIAQTLAAAIPPSGVPLMIALHSRAGRVFLADPRTGGLASHALDALPLIAEPVRIAGDAAAEVVARLGHGEVVDVRLPQAGDVAVLGLRQLQAGTLQTAQPLYVDEPLARLPG